MSFSVFAVVLTTGLLLRVQYRRSCQSRHRRHVATIVTVVIVVRLVIVAIVVIVFLVALVIIVVTVVIFAIVVIVARCTNSICVQYVCVYVSAVCGAGVVVVVVETACLLLQWCW